MSAVSEDVVAPRTRLTGSFRLAEDEVLHVLMHDATLHAAYKNAEVAIKHKAASERTLLAGKPRITIKVEVDWDGFVFPEDAQDLYEAERIGQALGVHVDDRIDTLRIRRMPRLLP